MNDLLAETLKERNKMYGDYKGANLLRSKIMSGITERYKSVHKVEMNTFDELCIFDIVNKLVRLSVSPEHLDSWLDIQGYSKRIYEMYDKMYPKETKNADK